MLPSNSTIETPSGGGLPPSSAALLKLASLKQKLATESTSKIEPPTVNNAAFQETGENLVDFVPVVDTPEIQENLDSFDGITPINTFDIQPPAVAESAQPKRQETSAFSNLPNIETILPTAIPAREIPKTAEPSLNLEQRPDANIKNTQSLPQVQHTQQKLTDPTTISEPKKLERPPEPKLVQKGATVGGAHNLEAALMAMRDENKQN